MHMNSFRFEITHQSSRSQARVGKIHTPHGIIETPNFVPVATNATLKAVASTQPLDIQLLFCNTYHLLLQPGTAVVKEQGGLHTFMQRTKPIITDSGGFQVFSLAYGGVHDELKSRGNKKHGGSVLSVTEEGVVFRSYIDGTRVVLTPESSVKAQKDLGADIIIPLDELPPYHIDHNALKESVAQTHRWEKRSLEEHLKNPQGQAMYGVIHGGVDQALRMHSIETLSRETFDGFAIGGSLGKTKEQLFQLLEFVAPRLPKDKPNHLLGIGDLPSVHQAVLHGIDTMDSAYPTKLARHGLVYTKAGNKKITHASNKNNSYPLDQGCTCSTCQNYSSAYIHHLFKAHELVGYTLASIHNLHFMVQLMADYRQKIIEGEL